MSTFSTQIERRINSFVSELRDLVNQTALNAVSAALGSSAPKMSVAPAASKPAKTAKRAKKRGRVNRTPAEIEKSVATILAFIKSHANIGSEKVRKDLKLDRPVVQDAIGRLMAAKKIKMKGVKRAATYAVA